MNDGCMSFGAQQSRLRSITEELEKADFYLNSASYLKQVQGLCSAIADKRYIGSETMELICEVVLLAYKAGGSHYDS